MGRPKQDGIRVTVFRSLLDVAEKETGWGRGMFMDPSEETRWFIRMAINYAIKEREAANVKTETV